MTTLPAFVWLILLLLTAAPLIYFIGQFRRASAQWAAVIALIAAWIPFALAINDLSQSNAPTYLIAGVAFAPDGLSLLLAGLALILGLGAVLYSGSYLADEDGQEEYFALLVALIGLASAADLFNLWIWFEAMAVCSYPLVAFYRNQRDAIAAGVKYLVQSAIGSILVLIGIALVLAETGSFTLAEIKAAATHSPMLLAAGGLFVVGFGVKAALVPLHTWLPDAHSQAPSGISALLSGIVIEAGLIALLRAVGSLSLIGARWDALLLTMGAFNMLIGNLLALRQTQVKRLLAYSSLSQVGYMLLGVGIGLRFGDSLGIQGGLFHLLTHGLMKGLGFLAAGALLYGLHLAVGDHHPLTTSDLNGAAKRYPFIALALSIAVLSLGGLPPFAGFISKWQIFAAGFVVQDALIAGLVIFAALNSVLSLAYYVPLVNRVYRQQPSPAVVSGQPIPHLMSIPLVGLAAAIVAIGIWPNLLTWLTVPASRTLLKAFGG